MRIPVILDVNPEPEALTWEHDFLQRLDIPVEPCCGPGERGACPMLSSDHCSKVDKADGVLFQLDLDRPAHRAILQRYVATLDIPIRVVVSKEQQTRWSELLEAVEVMDPPVGPAALDGFAAEVESSLV